MNDDATIYGTDLAIDIDTGDLLAWPNGALAVKAGVDNAVQAVYLRIKTTPGEVALHPEYGTTFSLLVGAKLAIPPLEGGVRDQFARIARDDPRFLAVRNVSVSQVQKQHGPGVRIGASLYLIGGETLNMLDLAEGVVETDQTDLTDTDALDSPDFLSADADEAFAIADLDATTSAIEDLEFGLLDPEPLPGEAL